MSSQARPPVVNYIVRHNTTDNGSSTLEELTEWTNITIHRALPGHVYCIHVTPVNVLGSGAARTTRELTPVNNHHESIHLASITMDTVTFHMDTVSCVQHCYYKAHTCHYHLFYIRIIIVWNVAIMCVPCM